MEEDYVILEVAKLLKEKGFNEECFALYNSESTLIQSGIRLNNTQVGRVKGSYSAPTLQMAMKWLRERHNLFIQIIVDFSDGAYPMYDVCVVDLARCTSIIVIGYDRYSYTQACEAAIKYCLENLI